MKAFLNLRIFFSPERRNEGFVDFFYCFFPPFLLLPGDFFEAQRCDSLNRRPSLSLVPGRNLFIQRNPGLIEVLPFNTTLTLINTWAYPSSRSLPFRTRTVPPSASVVNTRKRIPATSDHRRNPLPLAKSPP